MTVLSSVQSFFGSLWPAITTPAKPPVAGTPAANTMVLGEFKSGVSLAQLALTAIATKAVTLSGAEVAGEDVAQILADFDIPGASIAVQLIPLLPVLYDGFVIMAKDRGVTVADPMTTDDRIQFSRGR